MALPKTFSQIVNYFKANEMELTIDVTNEKMVVKNYVDGLDLPKDFVRTRIDIK